MADVALCQAGCMKGNDDKRRTIPALAATPIATGVLLAGGDIGAPPEEPGPIERPE